MTAMSTWISYNPNPAGRHTIDCAVRAVAKALDTDWDTAKILIAVKAFEMKTMDSGNSTWGAVLRDHGFRREIVPNTCPECYTAADFCASHPRGMFILGFDNHVATIIDGKIYDSWDSSHEIVNYYWTKEDA